MNLVCKGSAHRDAKIHVSDLKFTAIMEHGRPELQKLIRAVLHGAPDREAAMLAWRAVCGANVATRTRALEFRSGILRVEVPDKMWLAELSDLRPQYLLALSRLLRRQVREIQFVIPGEFRDFAQTGSTKA